MWTSRGRQIDSKGKFLFSMEKKGLVDSVLKFSSSWAVLCHRKTPLTRQLSIVATTSGWVGEKLSSPPKSEINTHFVGDKV